MSKFKMNDTVRYKKHSGLFLITGIDGQSAIYRGNESEFASYSITNKKQYEDWNPEDHSTTPKTVFHNVSEDDLEMGFE